MIRTTTIYQYQFVQDLFHAFDAVGITCPTVACFGMDSILVPESIGFFDFSCFHLDYPKGREYLNRTGVDAG